MNAVDGVKDKVIVYGLGNCWKQYAEKLRNDYEIICCSDQNDAQAQNCGNIEYIAPQDIATKEYDLLILCSYMFGMRESLVLKYGLNPEKMIYCIDLYENSQVIPRKMHKETVLNGKRKHREKLTIVIPTYNRKERLERTLSLLEMQTDDEFRVIILDNYSNYNIEEEIYKRDKCFQNRIRIIRNKTNIGMAGNLSNAFIQETEGWVWTLADDDIPSLYAVEDIYAEIEKTSNVGAISFSICHLSKFMPEGSKNFANLQGLLAFYQKLTSRTLKRTALEGDFIYFSNKVYNMNYVKKYCDKIFYYTYSGVPQVVPILFMLNEERAMLRISNKKIVGYESPDGDHWNWLETALGMRIITDFPLDINESEKGLLYSLIMVDCFMVIESVNGERSPYIIAQLEKLYDEVYRYFLNDKEKLEYKIKIEALKAKVE